MKKIILFLSAWVLGLGYLTPLLASKNDSKLEWVTGQQSCTAGDLKITLRVKTLHHVVESPVEVTLLKKTGEKFPTSGTRGSAQMITGTKAWITLQPKKEGLLQGFGKLQFEPDLEMELYLEIPGRGAVQARLSPFHKIEGAPPCYQR